MCPVTEWRSSALAAATDPESFVFVVTQKFRTELRTFMGAVAHWRYRSLSTTTNGGGFAGLELYFEGFFLPHVGRIRRTGMKACRSRRVQSNPRELCLGSEQQGQTQRNE